MANLDFSRFASEAPVDIRPPVARGAPAVPPVPRRRPQAPPDFSAFATDTPPARPDFSAFGSEEAPDEGNPFVSGLVGSLVGTNPKLAGDAAEGFGVLLDNEGLQKVGRDLSASGAARVTPPRVPSFTNIRTDNVGNFLADVGSYAGYQTGSAIGTSAPSLVAGLGATALTRNPILGIALGAAGPSYIQNYGDVYSSVRDSPDIQKLIVDGKLTRKGVAATAALAAIPVAGLDVLSLETVLGKTVFSAAKKDLLGRIAKGIATGAITEGATEGLQQVIQEWTQANLGDNAPLGARVISVLDNLIAGALGGGAMGGGAGIVSGTPRAAQQRNAPGAAMGAAAGAGVNEPSGVPPGATPADALYPEPEATTPPAAAATAVPAAPQTVPGATAPLAPDFSAQASERPLEGEIIPPRRQQRQPMRNRSGETVPDFSAQASAAPSGIGFTPSRAGASRAPLTIAKPATAALDFSAEATAPGTRALPVKVEKPEDLAAVAPVVNAAPTEPQKAVGNYAKAHINVQGLDITIENPKDSERTGKTKDGKSWSVRVPAAYGYLKRSAGADGDQVDVYVGEAPQSRRVFVVDQVDAESKAFDEHKAFVGFPDQQAALSAYEEAFSDGRGADRVGGVTEMSVADFKDWAKNGDTTKALTGENGEPLQAQTPRADAGPDTAVRAGAEGVPEGARPPKEGARPVAATPDRQDTGTPVVAAGNEAGNLGVVGAEVKQPGTPIPQAKKAEAAKAPEGKRLKDYSNVIIPNPDDRQRGDSDGGATKEAFLADGRNYLSNVARKLQKRGFGPFIGRKGKPNKVVSVNPGGPAVSGDVILSMRHTDGRAVYATIGTVLAGPSGGVSIMARKADPDSPYGGGKTGANQWLPVDLTAAELADRLEAIAGVASRVEPPGTAKPVEQAPPKRDYEAEGAAAFTAGKTRIIPRDIGGDLKGADAWYRGWDKANLAAPVPEAPIAPEWWTDLTEAGRAPLIAKASSTLSPKTTWGNLSDDNKARVTAAYKAQQKALRDAPTWAQVLSALPKGADGRPNIDMAFAMMGEITGERQPAYKDLSPEQQTELLSRAEAASKEVVVPAEPATTPAADPQVALATALAARLKAGDTITRQLLQDEAGVAFGGTMAEGKFDRKDAHDALELAVNMTIAADPSLRVDDGNWQPALPKLNKLLGRLPTQTVRSEEQITLQQFSTPPNYSAAVVYAANLRDGDTVLEPSAGTGSIVAAAMRPDVGIIANELAERRVSALKALIGDHGRVLNENAEQIDNVLPADVKPTVVVMNPPFSQTAGRMRGKKVIETGAIHIEQALKRLEPGGRLVAIVGRGMSMAAPRFRPWWNRISQNYAVRANIAVDGKVYAKYGTSFSTRLLVIDKVAPTSGEVPVLAEVSTVGDLFRALEPVRNGRNAATAVQPAAERQPAQPGGVEVAQDRPGGRRPGQPAPAESGGVGAGTAGGGRLAEPGNLRPAEPGGRPSGLAAGERGAVAPVEPGGAGQRAGAEPVERPARSAEPGTGGELRAERDLGPASEPESRPPASVERVELEQIEREPGSQAPGEITDKLYEAYQPQRVRVTGARPHPGPLVQSAAMASVLPPDVTYTPSLPADVIHDGLLSNAQLEAVVYAGQAHSAMLPAAEGDVARRKGFFIGDGTGVGKGREIAGIILDNWQQGRRKAIWVSEKKALINDAQRDWSGLGQNPKALFDVGKVSTGDPIMVEQGIAFATYDTLKGGMSDQAALARGGFIRKQPVTVNGRSGTVQRVQRSKRRGEQDQVTVAFDNGEMLTVGANEVEVVEGGAAIKSRVDQIVDWFGPEFDGVIAFDEAHNMGNAITVKGDRGLKEAAQKALAGLLLQQRLPNARVIYVSATGATEVANLAYADRLGLWGRGTAFADRNKFLNEIESGGIAAMELIARDMKQLGLYTARNLSYDGVEYSRLEHTLTNPQREIYDTLAEAWQGVLQNINAALEMTGGKEDRNAKSAAYSAFWGAHQRFFNQIITSMQMPSVVKAVERDLADGRQAVLQLTNTNEASQERAASKARTAEDIEDLDITPRDAIIQLVESSFPTQQYEPFIDEDGNERSRAVVGSDGKPVENREAVAMREALIERLASVRVPQGPLDLILDHFGIDQVAEVTGRKRRFVLKPGDDGQMRRVEESRPGSANVTEANAFQAGEKKILVFSEAGGTGRSYHADNTSASKKARRVHYLVQAGWRADRAVQGFGRTHRTNQASAPIFNLVTTDLQGQKRFISSIARRLGQLGALTKGQRQAGDQGLFNARDNLEGVEAKRALAQFYADLAHGHIDGLNIDDFEQATGLSLRERDKDGGVLGLKQELPPIQQFLNRLLSLKIDMQNRVFDAFSERLDQVIEARQAAGLLDVGLETIRADRITKTVEQSVYTDPESKAETKHVQLELANRFVPTDFESVRKADFWLKSPTGKVYAAVKAPDQHDLETGAILSQYRLISPVSPSHLIETARIDDSRSKWEKLEKPAAKQAWDAETAAAPEFITKDMHLVTGAILPIWDRLRGSPRVVRLQTDGGERFIGRVVPPSQIAETLKALGANATATGQAVDPASLIEQILGGARAELANGWSLHRSVVAGEDRIELVGPTTFGEGEEVKRDGVFTERIQYRTRYFVPIDSPQTIAAITKFRPVTSVEGGRATRFGSVADEAAPQVRATVSASKRARIERKASEIIQRIAGKDVRVRFEDTIPLEGTLPADQVAELRQAAASYGRVVRDTIRGYYDRAAGPLIAVALADPATSMDDALTTAGHEAWHHVEMALLTTDEQQVLADNMPAIREYAARERAVDGLPDYEATAYAFQRYRRLKEEGKPTGLSAAVRRIFEKIAKVLRAIRAMLSREKITRYEDIFEAARTGEIARRGEVRQQGQQAVEAALGSTTERTAQTETPAFKRWFGESKVVDADGKPLVVYHGSNRRFNTFKPMPGMRRDENEHPIEVESAAFFFTPDRDTARVFAKDRVQIDQRIRGKSGGRAQTRSFYLSVQNPLNLTGGRFMGRVPDPDAAAILGDMGYEPMTWADVQRALDDPSVVEVLKEEGFDGVRLFEEDGTEAWAAFEPTQIKSAIGNRGTFDPNNPSILGSTIEDDHISPFAPDGAEARKQAMAHGIEFAPLDRAMRLPFDIFGGRNAKGEWKPGLAVSKRAAHVITAARFSDSSRFHWLNQVLHRARAGLIDRYGLSEEYVARDRRRALDERGILADVPEIMHTLQQADVGSAEAQVLHAILTGEAAPSMAWQKVSEPIRNAIDAMGAEAVELGLISAESFERNRGAYLHRVYLKHENDQSGLSKWVSEAMGRRRKKIIGDELKGRGLWKTVDAEILPTEAGEEIAKGAQYDLFDKMSGDGSQVLKREWHRPGSEPAGTGWVSRGTWQVRGRQHGNIVLWRDYTKAERVKMGEITDARYTIAKTYMVMAHDLAVGRFYRDIAANADWTQSAEPKETWKEASDYSRFWADPEVEWVRVPDTSIPKSNTKRYGALAGKFVRAEIWRDINELEALNRSNLWQKLLTEWKLSKTARSPVVHMNNIVSNFLLMDMSGVTTSDLIAGIRSMVAGDALYEEANHHGAFGADMASQEIRRNTLEPILKEIEKSVQGDQSSLEARFGILGKLADGLWSGAKTVDRKMIDLYRMEDEVFRMALYIKRRSQGVEAQEAADETRQQFIDYDIRAPWINAARRTVLPFLSYTYRAVPLVARTVMTRPWKLAKYFAVAFAVNALSYLLVPGDEDEERRSMQEQESGMTWIGAPRRIRMPFADEYGNPVFLDIRRWIPAGDVFDLSQGSNALGVIPAPLQFGGPLMMGAELALNKQAFTGDPIVNELTDDWWDRTTKVSDWAWKSWMPSAAWVPGSWYWTKIGNAMKGARDWQGKPYNTPEAMLSSVGIKVAPQDVQEGFRIWGIKFHQVEVDLRSQMGRLAKDRARGLISDAEFEKQRNKLLDKLTTLGRKRVETFTGKPASR